MVITCSAVVADGVATGTISGDITRGVIIMLLHCFIFLVTDKGIHSLFCIGSHIGAKTVSLFISKVMFYI